MRGKNEGFELTMDLHKFKTFGRDKARRYQYSNYGEIGVSITKRIRIVSFPMKETESTILPSRTFLD